MKAKYPWMSRFDKKIGEIILERVLPNKSVLDVGCGTLQLYKFLKSHGWNGIYYGIDIQKYENVDYTDVNFILGDAQRVDFPKVDVVVMNDILEHVDHPEILVKKALNSKLVMMFVPKANPELWKMGVCEYHQLDKTHKHQGFTRKEIFDMVVNNGGIISRWMELIPIRVYNLLPFWESERARGWIERISRHSPTKVFYQEIFVEATPYERSN